MHLGRTIAGEANMEGKMRSFVGNMGIMLVFMIILQVVKRVFVETEEKGEYPEDIIKEELGEMEVFQAPRPDYWLRYSTVLKEVEHVVFSPEEILGKKFYSRVGIPETIGGEPEIDISEDLCPTKLADQDAMEIITGTLSFLSRFDIESIIYRYPVITPVDNNPHEIRCVCKRCMDDAQNTLGEDVSVNDIFKGALAGKASRAPKDVRMDLFDDGIGHDSIEIDVLIEKYKVEFLRIQEERKDVYRRLKNDYFLEQGRKMIEANRAILDAISKHTDASVKVVQPFLAGFTLEEDEDTVEYGRVAGFTKELMDSFDIGCIYGRTDGQGGDIILEFPSDKRGLIILTDDDDDKYNLRMISSKAESGDILVSPDDEESLIEVLKSLSMWL